MIKGELWSSILNYDHGLIESQPRMEMLEIMMREIITKVKLMLGKNIGSPKITSQIGITKMTIMIELFLSLFVICFHVYLLCFAFTTLVCNLNKTFTTPTPTIFVRFILIVYLCQFSLNHINLFWFSWMHNCANFLKRIAICFGFLEYIIL